MKWTVKQSMGSRALRSENGAQAATIRFRDGGYSVIAPDGACILTIREPAPLRLAVEGNGRQASADIRLRETSAMMRPPLAETASLVWDGDAYTVSQDIRREFSIFRSGTPVGHISGMLLGAAHLDLADGGPPELAALLYVLASRMLHEDDVDIV